MRFSLSSLVAVVLVLLLALLALRGGFSFFSGLPSLMVRLRRALRVRFFALAEPPLSTGEDAVAAVAGADAAGAVEEGTSMTVDKKSLAVTIMISTRSMYIGAGVSSVALAG